MIATTRWRSSLSLWVVLLIAPAIARASEHVVQRNGFPIDCVRHEVQGDKVRLYFAPATAGGQEGYADLPASAVLNVEVVTDPPALEFAAASSTPAVPLLAPAENVPPTSAELKEMLARAGAQHHVDADLLASVGHAESGGRVGAVSRTGARGLMQLMPGTATELGVKDSFAAEGNVQGGATYLDGLLTRYHDNIALALAAYNAGPGAVDRYHGVPPYRETRGYVARVIREFNRRKTTLLAQSR